ncbi:hybrid sensor histidine kinase/response regulator [Stenomitos frigidus]|uniref:histidine kinase n=1 Tax=Stenomitos frigidus ULC18 TaxID=2107698 RepID=A0A2T1E1R3_9CYAN|nr:ATP-binding protein [Stenomitos frigidus]PSB26679.1 hybrid sensor histidine kinase/response regulator [Stenomitos frigidus ULC18]
MSAKILVVEDEPIIALDIQRQLIQLGYTVVAIADCAAVALKAVERWRPDLALMDIRLRGDKTGIETAVQIRQQHPIPIVFLTAHADRATIEQVKAAQPYGYIVKPFETHNLITAIEVALNKHQAEMVTQAGLEKEKKLNEMKSNFIATVSHEFRNPLSTILLSLDLLERGGEQLTPAKKRLFLQRARVSVDRMEQLLEEVLLIGTVEAGELQCHLAPVDSVEFCRQLVAEFQHNGCTTTDPQHVLVLTQAEMAIDSTRFYDLDEKLLRHILTNLLSNAIKYSPDGGKVQLDLKCTPDGVTFQVCDDGIGIPPDDYAQLYDRFHRASNVKMIPGSGLGLSIAKQCVDLHGGTITFKSAVGIGTTFTVSLPATLSPNNSQ